MNEAWVQAARVLKVGELRASMSEDGGALLWLQIDDMLRQLTEAYDAVPDGAQLTLSIGFYADEAGVGDV